MPSSDDESRLSDVRPVTSHENAEVETHNRLSMQTTLPEILPLASEMPTTDGGQRDRTAVAPWDSGSPPRERLDKFAGMLGRYQFQRTLGEGAFGIVVQVWDPELQTHRAIKLPHRELIAAGRVDAEAYVREARKVTQLGKHAGIVEVLDVQRMDDGTPYVVSEFISGGSLADRMLDTRMPWQESVALVAQVADAIGYAHSKGVVHRDLKPANILFTADGKPVVVDFGLALGDEDFNYRAVVCGTYYYMSPQQIRGEANRLDGRSDIYSLGVVLYQLLTGRMPYKSRDVQSLRREISEDQPTPLRQYSPDVPPAVQAVCQRAMAKEVNDRYNTAGDFATALRGLLTAPGDDGARQDRRSIGPWITAAAAGLCILTAAGLFALSRHDAEFKSMPAVAAGAATPDLSIHFQKASAGTFAREMEDADLPLEAGDKLQFFVEQLPKPMFAYVYWLDSAGKPNRVWPVAGQPLADQSPVDRLSSPPGAGGDAIDQPWWEIPAVGGAQIFFLGVADKPLDEKQLSEFEAQSEPMRDALLGTLRRSGKHVAEFEYPQQAKMYTLQDGELYRTRGGNLHLVISPKIYASDHSRLQKWFSAYHGWVVATKD